jgi:hypothetical protein
MAILTSKQPESDQLVGRQAVIKHSSCASTKALIADFLASNLTTVHAILISLA